jgi:predicted KAP-like P-loop ATPase
MINLGFSDYLDENQKNQIKKIWEDDKLDRASESLYIIEYIKKKYEVNPDQSYVMNINGEWGFGKTYFMQNSYEMLKVMKHPVIYFDAWKNDYTNNPLLAFISELNESMSEHFKDDVNAKKYFNDAYKAIKATFLPILMKKLTGHALEELEEKINAGKNELDDDVKDGISSLMTKAATFALSEHNAVKDSIKSFKDKMKILLEHIHKNVENQNLPLFILIDELDRCRPSYAIELLENIKHIFDIPRVVFFIATDSKQLAHSINAIYGNNFASDTYLKRFFDQEYTLLAPKRHNFGKFLLEQYKLNESKNYFVLFEPRQEKDNTITSTYEILGKYFNLSLRDHQQVITSLETITLTYPTNAGKLHFAYMVFLIMFKQKFHHQFEHIFFNTSVDKRIKKLEEFLDSQENLNKDSLFDYLDTELKKKSTFCNAFNSNSLFEFTR